MTRKITNLFGIPEIIANAIRKDQEAYDKGPGIDYSATELQKPPLIRRLEYLHEDDIEEDVIDMVWLLFGNAIHYMVAQGATRELTEKRYEAVVEVDGVEYWLSGQADSLDVAERHLDDWKTANVWSVLDGIKEDWVAQVNVYRWILAMCGIEIDTLAIGCFFKNWSIRDKQRSGSNYPPASVWKYDVPAWPLHETEEYIRDRIRTHDEPVPRACTDEERWQRPTKYALKKQGRKSAVKVEDTLGSLELYAIGKGLAEDGEDFSLKPKYSVEVRTGAYVRCTEGGPSGSTYCPVSRWCPIMNPENPWPGKDVENFDA